MTAQQLSLLQPASGATFSPCGTYRYHLWRQVNEAGAGRVAFLMLNPSTADAQADDPTIRRCIGFARDWGYRWLDVLNIFAYRSTDPRALRDVADPVGPENDDTIGWVAGHAGKTVAAWGVHGALHRRAEIVLDGFQRIGLSIYHLGLTKDGHPRHPLYLPKTVKPQLYNIEEA